MNLNRYSLRTKVVVLGIAIPALLVAVLFHFYTKQVRENTEVAFTDKARAICLSTESICKEMEDKWDMGLFTTNQLKEYAQKGQTDKLMGSIPVVTAWESAMRKAEEGGYEFKVPKFSPRNKKNTPDSVEDKALKFFESSTQSDYFVYDQEKNAIRFFRPIHLTQSCMSCHGDPSKSKELWGNDQGLDCTGGKMEGWKIGEVHGAFEVIQSLKDTDTKLNSALLIVLGGLGTGGMIFYLFFRSYVEKPFAALTQRLTLGSHELELFSAEVSAASQKIAEGTSETASSLEETSASLEELSSMTNQNADNARQADALATSATSKAAEGQQATQRIGKEVDDRLADMSGAMQKIHTSTAETAKIIKTIDEIAFQTNLLALNAAVEAARAGEAGKGFAVVAEEVRNLARRSAEAAKTTAELIDQSQRNAENGVKKTSEVAELIKKAVEVELSSTFHSMADSTQKVKQLISEVATASQEQARGNQQIAVAVSEMDKVTQANAAGAEETAAVSDKLHTQAADFTQAVAQMVALVEGKKENPQQEKHAANPQKSKSQFSLKQLSPRTV